MTSTAKRRLSLASAEKGASRVSRKDQILSLYMSGMTEVEDLAMITGARPSYVGSVLQEAGMKPGYFDLYTSTAHPMNVYSKFFAGKLGFRDEDAARESVRLIDRLYRQFEFAQDRAGQHHALAMALTMFDRARWTGKRREAAIFRGWLEERLAEADLSVDEFPDEREIAAAGDTSIDIRQSSAPPAKASVNRKTGQAVEDAEKNLSRYSTADSAPPVAQQWRTTSRAGAARVSGKQRK